MFIEVTYILFLNLHNDLNILSVKAGNFSFILPISSSIESRVWYKTDAQ